MKLTRISPSADPVTKCSSCGSMARHLIAFSCAWNRWRSVRWRTSNMQTSPFLPAEINNWCCGAYTKLDAPCSWHANAKNDQMWIIIQKTNFFYKSINLHATIDFFCGNNVSHNPTFLLSELWPAVATKLHEPKNTKSEIPLLWHWYV